MWLTRCVAQPVARSGRSNNLHQLILCRVILHNKVWFFEKFPRGQLISSRRSRRENIYSWFSFQLLLKSRYMPQSKFHNFNEESLFIRFACFSRIRRLIGHLTKNMQLITNVNKLIVVISTTLFHSFEHSMSEHLITIRLRYGFKQKNYDVSCNFPVAR